MAGTYHFFDNDDNTTEAYDFDRARQSGSDVAYSDILSGLTSVSGATATETRIAILEHQVIGRHIRILDREWNRQSSEDVTLSESSHSYDAICATDDRWVVLNSSLRRLEFYTFAGVEQTSERQSLTSNKSYRGLFSDGTYIYIVNISDDTVERRTYTSTTLTTFITAGSNINWRGGTSTSTRFVLLRATGADFYNHSGTEQPSEAITFASSGNYDAALALEDTDATLTLSTTDTDIRAGEPVNINIASDIDITDFIVSDIAVTGGTRGALTGSGMSWTLVVVAGTAGTMNIAIAEDVVSPGNAAVDADFTVNARVSASITFDETELLTDGTTEVTVTFNEAVNGFIASELTTSAGTLSAFAFTDGNTTATATLTAPATGDGTITVTVAANAVTAGGLGNIVATNTIDYAEPPSTLVVTVSGTTDIEQGAQTTLTATVTDEDTNTITAGLTYAWTASQGRFVGSTTGASVTYEANFMDTDPVDVTITCAVTLAANENPTVSAPSLTALSQLGYEDIRVNMLVTTGDISSGGGNAQVIYRDGQTGSLADGSDDVYSAESRFHLLRWRSSSRQLILNRTGTLAFTAIVGDGANIGYGIVVIMPDGSRFDELWTSRNGAGGGFINWQFDSIDDADFISAIEGLDAGDQIVFGVADLRTYGLDADSGTGTATVTAAVATNIFFTVSTDDTKIYAGENVDFNIVASQDVTQFVATDITVTGGTRGNLTETDAQNYVLRVTAGSAGTLNIDIAEDVVAEGNNAVDEDFTVHALTTPSAPTIDSIDPDRTSAEVTIIAPTDTGGSAITGYRYRVAEGSTIPTSTTWTNTGSTDTTFTIPNLTAGTEHAVEVQAINAQGNGTASSVSTFTTDALPTVTITAAPTFVQNNGTSTVTMVWSEAPTGFAAGDVSVDVGTFTNFTNVNTTTWTGTVTAPATGDGTITVTVAENAITEGNAETTAAITYGASSGLAIAAVAAQSVPVLIEYELPIQVTGDPLADGGVKVEGLVANFSYDWDATNRRITIKSPAPSPLLLGLTNMWTITVTDGTDTVTREVMYTVVHSPPMLSRTTTLRAVVPGTHYDELIPVVNNPASAEVNGLLVGLDSVLSTEGTIGVRIFGQSADNEYTQDDGTFSIEVDNTGGMDSYDYDFDIVDGTKKLIGNSQGPSSVTGSESVFVNVLEYSDDYYFGTVGDPYTFSHFNLSHYLASDDNYVYLLTMPAGNILRAIRIDKDNLALSDPGGQSIITHTKLASESAAGIATDGTDLFIGINRETGNDRVVVYPLAGGTSRTFSLSGVTDLRAIAIDGNSLVALHFSTTRLHIDFFNKNTANNGTASSTSRILNLGGLDLEAAMDIEVDSDKVYFTESAGGRFYAIDRTDNSIDAQLIPTAYQGLPFGIAGY